MPRDPMSDLYAALRPFLQRDGTYVIPNTMSAVASIGLALVARERYPEARVASLEANVADPREALTALLGEVGFMRSCIASGEKLTPTDLERQDGAMARATKLLATPDSPRDGDLRAALEPCFTERQDCIHGQWEAVGGDHFGEHLEAALATRGCAAHPSRTDCIDFAFTVLGWDDPHPAPEARCDEPGCMKQSSCGWPTRPGGTGLNGGYRHTCGDHYRALNPGRP